jgi:hypothetical protein
MGLLAYMLFPCFSQRLWNTGLNVLNFCRSKTGVGALVLRTAEARADRALEGHRGSDRGPSLATFTGHCEREKNYQRIWDRRMTALLMMMVLQKNAGSKLDGVYIAAVGIRP